MMNADELERLQGANDLVQVGIAQGARQVLDIQLAITRAPYSALRCVGVFGPLIQGIEATQEAITRAAYGGVVLGSHGARALVAVALAVAAARAKAR